MENESILKKNIEKAQQSLKRRYTELYNEIGVERLLTDIQKNDWKVGEIVFTDRINSLGPDYRYFFGYGLEAAEMGNKAFISISSNAAIQPEDLGATLNQLLMVHVISDAGISGGISVRGINMRDANLKIRGLLALDRIAREKEHKFPFENSGHK